MRCDFNQLVTENITLPRTWKTTTKIMFPKKIKMSDAFLSKMKAEFESQLPTYTNEEGTEDKKKCKEDFKKALLMAATQL